MNQDAIRREIHALEDRRYEAMLAGDADILEQLLGDGLVYTHSSGTTDTKTTYIEGVKANKLTYRAIERLQEHIQVYGDTAVVTGRAHLEVLIDGVPRQANLRYIAVWVKASQGWQTLAFQATPIAA